MATNLREGTRVEAEAGLPVEEEGLAAMQTVSLRFRGQLEKLTATLRSTQPHYIKCVKPNSVKAAGALQAKLVVEQLRYSGVLEMVRIRQEGYPTRLPFRDVFLSLKAHALRAQGEHESSMRGCWRSKDGHCSERIHNKRRASQGSLRGLNRSVPGCG